MTTSINGKGLWEKVSGGGDVFIIKRAFGEYVSIRKFANMAKEMVTKVLLYSTFMRMGHDYG